MFGSLFAFLLVLISVNSWILDVSHNHVTPTLTSNVTIKCHSNFNDQNTQQIKYVFLIQISKLQKQMWQTVASMTPRDVLVKTNLTYAIATGSIDTTKNSYIQIHYNFADGQTHGQYVCQVAGIDKKFKFISIKTEPVVITEDKVTYTDVLKMLGTFDQHEKDNKSEWEMMKYIFVQMYADLQKVTAETNTMKVVISNITILDNNQSNKMDDLKLYISTAITNLTTHQETMNNDQSKKMDDLKMYMSTSIKDITTHQETENSVQSKKMDDLKLYITNITTHQETEYSGLKVYINNISTQQEIIHNNIYDQIKSLTDLHRNDPALTWPAGNYTIPKPDTGCPNTLTSTWAPSSIRISTAPNDNNDSSSSNLNLAGNVFEKINNNNYVTLKLCSMTGGGHGPVWPAGSYCVQAYSYIRSIDKGDCPSIFHYGVKFFRRFDDNSKDVVDNLPGYYGEFSKFRSFIIYCCRDDGSPTNPIKLPPRQHFYLYRFRGRCQEVVGMTVSDQWIHTDTGKWGIKDKYIRSYNTDGSITNGVTIRLCYYTPRY